MIRALRKAQAECTCRRISLDIAGSYWYCCNAFWSALLQIPCLDDILPWFGNLGHLEIHWRLFCTADLKSVCRNWTVQFLSIWETLQSCKGHQLSLVLITPLVACVYDGDWLQQEQAQEVSLSFVHLISCFSLTVKACRASKTECAVWLCKLVLRVLSRQGETW